MATRRQKACPLPPPPSSPAVPAATAAASAVTLSPTPPTSAASLSHIAPTTSASKPAHNWVDGHVTFAIVELLELAQKDGQRAGAGFKKSAFNHIATRLNASFGTSVTASQVTNKLNAEKAKLSWCLKLKNLSGWGWNNDIKAPTANDDVVAAYVAVRELVLLSNLWTNQLSEVLLTMVVQTLRSFAISMNNMAMGRLAAGFVGSRISTATKEPDVFDNEDESFGYSDENLGSSSLSHSLQGLLHITALGSSVSAGSNASGFTTPSPQLSVEPSGKRQKLSATNGERPPRSHTSGSSSKDQIVQLTRCVDRAFLQLEAATALSPPLPPPPPVEPIEWISN
ncbi:UNVERIFIED_CONTAM: hypothetical protein HDU68_008160 [Siphonaria sp. JEL0065]|nr:hypothetical protein HDU68_008160 [Siphonaria sp. JEL0065]